MKIAIIGTHGSGKSYLAKSLYEELCLADKNNLLGGLAYLIFLFSIGIEG